ncbi:hypothetical protein [Aeromonas phage L9-6]|nr:hypothetical protein [Aeromonas phage L9-6]
MSSGKAIARTIKKHERRRFNDIAAIRNVLNSMTDPRLDCIHTRTVLRIMGVSGEKTQWPTHQFGSRFLPVWFWTKVDRVMKETLLHPRGSVVETEYHYHATKATVREIKLSLNDDAVKIARLFGIEIFSTNWAHYHNLAVLTRTRRIETIEKKTRVRPPKPKAVEIHASTERIDQVERSHTGENLEGLTDQLKQISELTIKLEALSDEACAVKHKILNLRAEVKRRLSEDFGI